MKAVRVQYTVKPEFIEENKQNIQRVMNALREQPIDGMMYSSYTDNDNPAIFIHINICRDDETMSKLNDIPEFLEFRMALKSSQPVSPPNQTKLDLVDSNFNF